MSSGKILLGVVAGAAAGAILGLLIAPGKGSATRKRIARTGLEYADEANDKFNEYVDAATGEYDTAKKSGIDLVSKAKERVRSVADLRLR